MINQYLETTDKRHMRRQLLSAACALLSWPLVRSLKTTVGAQLPKLPAVRGHAGFVIIDGWVLPGQYFRD